MPDNDNVDPAEALTGTIRQLLATQEDQHKGINLIIEVVTGLEKRVRALELRERREDRAKAWPAILNPEGNRAN